MKLNYANQRILITGASAGIGREMAYLLAEKSPKCLVLVARRATELEQIQAELCEQYPGIKILVCPCDLSQQDDIDRLMHRISLEIGAVDILINNAGLGDYGLFEDSDWSKIERMLRVNIEGLTYLSHRVLPAMIALGRGGILNVSSGFGFFFMPGMAVYAATKHYVTAFTEALRLECHKTGVVIAQSCPGPVVTEFSQVANMKSTGERYPRAVVLDAKTCAKQSLDGFARGQAITIPGTLVRLGTRLGWWVPRSLQRLALSGLRQKHQAKQAIPTQAALHT